MKQVISSILLIFSALCDLTASTILFCHGIDFKHTFSTVESSYNFHGSTFDLWTLAVLRCSIVLGIAVALLFRPQSSVIRVRQSKFVSVVVAVSFSILILIKLLAVAENDSILQDVWFWMFFSWNLVTSVLFIPQWILIGRIHIFSKHNLNVNVNGDSIDEGVNVNGDSIDGGTGTEPLLDTECGTGTGGDKSTGKTKDTVKLNKGTIRRLLSYSRPDVLLILVGFIFLVLSSVGEIFVPFYTGRVVDGIVIDRSQKEFTDAIIAMSLISLGSAIAAGIRGGCLFIAIRRLNLRIRNLLFASIIRQEIGFFDTIQTGDITSRLTSDTTTVSDALGLNVNIFLRSLIKAVGVVFFMFKLSWRLSVVTVIGLPFVLAVSKLYGKYYEKLAEQVQDSLAVVNSVAEEACSTMRTVRSFANEDGEIARYTSKLGTTYRLYKKQGWIYSGFVWCTRSFELALTVAVLYYGGHLVMVGRLSGGKLISFILYQIQLGDCLDGMGNMYTGLMQAAGASHKVFEYMDRTPRITNDGKLAPTSLRGHVEFRDVSFAYPTRPDTEVLKGVTFSVSPGEVVALVGPSGGGKTSCVNLLEHFYTSTHGQVLLDSVPIQQYDHHYLHKQVSLVGQEPVLYARTVRENIHYGLEDSEWTEEQVQEVARLASAHKFISEMADGYNTQAGEKGVQLSGGQKQRIAIARALLRKPTVLLLDEATSALDSESEYVVQQALYRNLSGRTVIVIAHRLSTVETADRIIVIDHGRVVDQGNHQQLLQRPGLYANLVKRQLLRSDNSDRPDSSPLRVSSYLGKVGNSSVECCNDELRGGVDGGGVLCGCWCHRRGVSDGRSYVKSTVMSRMTGRCSFVVGSA